MAAASSPDPNRVPDMTWRQTLRLGRMTMLGCAYPRLIAGNREPDWIFYYLLLYSHKRCSTLR